MFDYTKAKNIASDILSDKVRISTATFPGYYGDGYETWIFSRDDRVKTRQIWHRNKNKALSVHGHIVKNLRKVILAQS